MTMNGMFDDKPKPPTLDGMIACAKRELALRKNVYPRWVKAGKMKQHSADNELRNMQGIVDCLTKLSAAVDTMVDEELGPRSEEMPRA